MWPAVSNFEDLLDFWFNEISPKQWWDVSPEFDKLIYQRFGITHQKAVSSELWSWRTSALGALAEIIVIDQFSRNIHRGNPKAFVYDSIALVLAQNAIKEEFDKELSHIMRSFIYLPFMHSESALIHCEAVKLYSQKGLEYNLDFELKHKEVIDQFGRYPHRNQILGRESTAEELEFLKINPGW